MNDLINYVIAKKLASKIKLTKGQYDVKGKVLLEVDAVVTKGEDESYTPTAELPIKEILAAIVRKYKIKQDELEELIVEAYRTSVNNDSSLKEELDYTEHTLAKVNKVLGKLPEKTREGKTTINGIVRIISPETGLVIPKARG